MFITFLSQSYSPAKNQSLFTLHRRYTPWQGGDAAARPSSAVVFDLDIPFLCFP